MQQFSSAGIYIVQTVFGIYSIIVLLRFLLQTSRADFYNPASQFVVKATNPILIPLRRVIPGFGGIDIASLVLLFAINYLQIILIALMFSGGMPNLAIVAGWAATGIVSLILNFYFFAIIIQIILSWIAPHNHSPALALLYQLTEPIMAPARKILPPMGGIDFSPILTFMMIQVLKMILVGTLVQVLQMPSGLLLGM